MNLAFWKELLDTHGYFIAASPFVAWSIRAVWSWFREQEFEFQLKFKTKR